jgi:hypothetical protein
MTYYRGWITLPLERSVPCVTEKAVAMTVAGGATTANDTFTWFPKSQLIIGEPNEYGNAEILIPCWLIRKKSYKPTEFFRRLREVNAHSGEDEIVDR